MRLSAALLFMIAQIAGGRVTPLMAQSGDDPGETSRPLPTPNEQFRLSAASTGTAYEISVYLPESYGTRDDDFPVLYALDGDASFDELAARAVRESIHSESIVVGIGYGLPADDRRPLRVRDYTPSPVPGLAGSGGAADFLEFVEQTLAPHLESRFRIDPTRSVLAGHSLGGFLVLYALFSASSPFDAYIALSPSVAIDDFAGLRSTFDAPGDGDVDLVIAVGGDEDPARMIEPVERFVASLRENPPAGIRLRSAFIEHRDHFSVVDPGLAWALQELAGR